MAHSLFKITVFVSLLLNARFHIASCYIPDKNLAFFIESKNIYLVTIIDTLLNKNKLVYRVSVLKNFNGPTRQELLVNDFKTTFGTRLKKDSLYLIQPTFDENRNARLDICSYVLSNYHREFKRDSICFSSFSSHNCLIDNEYFKGEMVNGHPHGMWHEDKNYGFYKHGKKTGKWMEFGSAVIYKNDKRVYFEELLHPDTLVIHTDKSLTMYYKKEPLRIWKQHRFRGDKISKYENGKIQQSITYYSTGLIKKINCYTNGKLIYSKRYEYDPYKEQKELIINDVYYPYADEYFYFLNFKCLR